MFWKIMKRFEFQMRLSNRDFFEKIKNKCVQKTQLEDLESGTEGNCF